MLQYNKSGRAPGTLANPCGTEVFHFCQHFSNLRAQESATLERTEKIPDMSLDHRDSFAKFGKVPAFQRRLYLIK